MVWRKEGSKKFTGGNQSLIGKIFDVSSKEAVHQFVETMKSWIMLGRNTPTEEISSTCLKISYITILLDQITLRMMDTAIWYLLEKERNILR